MTQATGGSWLGWDRLAGGLRRRVRWLRWRLVGDRPSPVETALAWLFGPETVNGVPPRVGGAHGCPITTASAIAVALEYGMTARALRRQEWLQSLATAEVPVDLVSVLKPNAGARLAARAVASYEAGDRGDGDWVMRRLARTRLRSGVAIVCYLKAALLQVQAAFAQSPDDLPDEIDPADGRVQAVLRWAGQLGPGATLADVGCGKGRFLRHLAAACPEMKLVGIDPSAAMLARLPPGVQSRQGSLLAIPAPDAKFDAALAVESLEHALVPAHAVEELCRVVRPGGRVLVIDKHRAKQARSEYESWERWFWPEELAAWLGRFCDEVRVEAVAHLEGRPGEDLFLAASGRRILTADEGTKS